MNQADTAALIERARRGDMDALGRLYDAHAAEVLRVAYRLLLSRDEAEDVVQDVFIGLPEALRTLSTAERLAPWLRRVAARAALMRMRSQARRRQSPLEGEVPALSPERGIAHISMADALARLEPKLRVVFVLKEVEGYGHAEIAEMLDITPANSEVRLHRARRRLRALLGG